LDTSVLREIADIVSFDI
jgi:hypothetical protein